LLTPKKAAGAFSLLGLAAQVFRPNQSDISRALRPRAWNDALCVLSRTTIELEALLMWLSSLFSRVGAGRSSASGQRTRPHSRRERFRPQVEALEARLAPALLIVGSLTDTAVDLTDATVTLRDAVFAANNDLQVSPGGPTGSGSDEIQFQSGLIGTIPLSQGELAITSSLTITGPGASDLTISGGSLSRIFHVDDAAAGPTIDVEITGLTLTGGSTLASGGAIASFENLTVTGAVLTGNSAVIEGGGIYNDGGTLTIDGSTLSENSAGNTGSSNGGHSDTGGGGGAIFNSGTATITGSTLSDNFTGTFGDGGGILNFGGTLTITGSILSDNSGEFGAGIIGFEGSAVTIANSTLSDNEASDAGGGIAHAGMLTITGSTLSGNSAALAGGGGIYNFDGTVTIANSTLSGNSAGEVSGDHDGGGIVNGGGTLTLTNTTLSGNSATGEGGGILNAFAGTLTLTNCTLSGNSSGVEGGGIFNSFNSSATLNNSIVANSGSGGQIASDGALTGSHNLIEGESPAGLSGTITADPQLGPLQFNGGPTRTHALKLGSPAIDAGDNALVPGGVTTDQRGPGFARLRDGDDDGTTTVDIGAFEFVSPQDQVEDLCEQIQGLVADGSLNHGQANALKKKLEHALTKIERGQIHVAINQLNAFVNQVEAFVAAGILSEDEGDALLDGVNALLASITP
jgi:hypothetical protein